MSVTLGFMIYAFIAFIYIYMCVCVCVCKPLLKFVCEIIYIYIYIISQTDFKKTFTIKPKLFLKAS